MMFEIRCWHPSAKPLLEKLESMWEMSIEIDPKDVATTCGAFTDACLGVGLNVMFIKRDGNVWAFFRNDR